VKTPTPVGDAPRLAESAQIWHGVDRRLSLGVGARSEASERPSVPLAGAVTDGSTVRAIGAARAPWPSGIAATAKRPAASRHTATAANSATNPRLSEIAGRWFTDLARASLRRRSARALRRWECRCQGRTAGARPRLAAATLGDFLRVDIRFTPVRSRGRDEASRLTAFAVRTRAARATAFGRR
jgi:hypothetical protein